MSGLPDVNVPFFGTESCQIRLDSTLSHVLNQRTLKDGHSSKQSRAMYGSTDDLYHPDNKDDVGDRTMNACGSDCGL